MDDAGIHRRKLGLPLAVARAAYGFISRSILPTDKLRLRQIDRGGIKYLVWQHEDIGRKLILLREFEKAETLFFRALLREGDVCVDVGGNIGYFSLNFGAACGPSGAVHVFEPITRNSLVIELAAEINEIHNLHIFRGVATDVPGPVEMTVPKGDSAYAHIATGSDQKEPLVRKVPGVTLDDYLADRGSPAIKVIKIDVEGAEFKVLKGAKNTLCDPERRPDVVMVELVPAYLARFSTTADEVISFMGACGFTPHSLTNHSELMPFDVSVLGNIVNVFFIPDGQR